MLNGHEYVACQARKAGITFTKQGNCFTHVICDECINDVELLLAEYKAWLLATNKSGAWDTGDEDE